MYGRSSRGKKASVPEIVHSRRRWRKLSQPKKWYESAMSLDLRRREAQRHLFYIAGKNSARQRRSVIEQRKRAGAWRKIAWATASSVRLALGSNWSPNRWPTSAFRLLSRARRPMRSKWRRFDVLLFPLQLFR